MILRPMNQSERRRLRNQFPTAFAVVAAAEVLALRSANHEAAILQNAAPKDLQDVEEAEARAVDSVTKAVRQMNAAE